MANMGNAGRKKNDGRGRLGGRAKGTPNKATASFKNWLAGVLEDNRATFENDIKLLPPDERVKILSGLFGYVIPKMTALTVEEQIKNEKEALTQWLDEAPDEAINGIAKRVLELQKMAGYAVDGDDDETSEAEGEE